MPELVTADDNPRPNSGLVAYDGARWIGGVPRIDRVYSGFGISTVLQCGMEGEGETVAEVPPTDFAVSLFRIAAAASVDRRICGRPARMTYRVGDGTLLAPGTDSVWAVDATSNAGWFHVHFTKELLTEVEAAHNLRLETVPDVSDRQITMLVNLIFELVSRAEDPEPILWQSLGQVLLWRLLLLTAQTKRRDETRGGLAPWQAKRTTEYLADNLERRVTLDELAGIARLSPFHFARAFTKTLGMPPYRYHQKLRMERACDLLARSEMRVIDIALAVGYESPQALARVFAQTYGMSPSLWRRRHGTG
jgi:AraC-like DNA-binding protein